MFTNICVQLKKVLVSNNYTRNNILRIRVTLQAHMSGQVYLWNS